MNRSTAIAGAALGVTVLGGAGYVAYSRWRKRAPAPGEAPAPEIDTAIESPTAQAPPATDTTGAAARVGLWENVKPLPTMAEVPGDYDSNWGSTPALYRPLFLLMEQVSKIPGAARVFSVISYGEAQYVPTAHNGDGTSSRDQAERIQSARAWKSMQTRGYNEQNTPHGPAGAEFGSGGLFGMLAPYFLASGAVSLGKANAPLLRQDPRIIFVPRVSAFCAVVYLAGLLTNPNYLVPDIPAVKVGWASPSFLTASQRGGDAYLTRHAKFQRQATEVGIDLGQLPPKLSPHEFPGVMPVFDQLVGALPTLGVS